MDRTKIFSKYFNKEVKNHCVIGTHPTGNKLYLIEFANGTEEKIWLNLKNPDTKLKEIMEEFE